MGRGNQGGLSLLLYPPVQAPLLMGPHPIVTEFDSHNKGKRRCRPEAQPDAPQPERGRSHAPSLALGEFEGKIGGPKNRDIRTNNLGTKYLRR